MLGYQIDRCVRYLLRKSNVHYLGLYEISKFNLTNTCGDKWLTILNYQDEHWLLLYCDRKKELFIFADSLGRDVAEYSPSLSLELQETFGPQSLAHLPFPVQSSRSRVCGYFVIYWSYLLSQGASLRRLFASFSPVKLQRNDGLVRHWMEEHFPTILHL